MPRKKQTEEGSIRLSPLDEDILTVLMGGRELYGLEILDELNLDERPGGELGFGSLYPALNRLDKKGLIDWRWGNEHEETGGARRKYYKINGLGARVLREVREYRNALAVKAQA
ncbi:MAG: helix-turn-helix transcriptional regulator [Cyanobacteria bacterium SBLK]|nr:helix-turn-helix transcriptional regulator [Cyanobacteria bacterium SBLK]